MYTRRSKNLKDLLISYNKQDVLFLENEQKRFLGEIWSCLEQKTADSDFSPKIFKLVKIKHETVNYVAFLEQMNPYSNKALQISFQFQSATQTNPVTPAKSETPPAKPTIKQWPLTISTQKLHSPKQVTKQPKTAKYSKSSRVTTVFFSPWMMAKKSESPETVKASSPATPSG